MHEERARQADAEQADDLAASRGHSPAPTGAVAQSREEVGSAKPVWACNSKKYRKIHIKL